MQRRRDMHQVLATKSAKELEEHMAILILLRHGQSVWNKENRFTGWTDVGLSPQGESEARAAGRRIAHLPIDRVFTSVLQRAIRTAEIALHVAGKPNLPIAKDQALNERDYGDLTGLNKDEMRQQFGEAQVHIWRRSFDVKPPGGESLKDTCARVMPYYRTEILPLLKGGENLFVAAHGNSLRALIKDLENISDDDIVKLEIATGLPIVYTLDRDGVVLRKEILDSDPANQQNAI